MIALEQINAWLETRETENIEFKVAKNSYSLDNLVKYTAAIANEGGGYFVLGITPKLPRRVVGSQAFLDLPTKVQQLLQKVRLRVQAEEVQHPDGRVVVFTIPPRPIGVPIGLDGRYLMRAGESLTAMTSDMLKRIFDEAVPDYSAEVCPEATIDDLDPAAIETFGALWRKKSNNAALAALPAPQLLEDAGLMVGGGVTIAALILLGTRTALARHLAQAEVVFEYRSSETPGAASQRAEFRQGFLTFFEELWALINLRNDIQHYQEGLFVWDIATFNERACREAVLNAVSHRDYRSGASVFVRQYPRRLVIESPGGFPPGITEENILYRQSPRNRLLAENLARCGFVERSGQGADLMFRLCIEEGKPRPDYAHTDAHWVFLTLHGTVQDPHFVGFLEQVATQRNLTFGLNDLLVLSLIHEGKPLPVGLAGEVRRLLDAGVIERVARKKLILSRRFYRFLKKPGEYTRKKGLDRGMRKALLLSHIESVAAEGTRMDEFLQVLPGYSRHQINGLLRELRSEGKVHMTGSRRTACWWPGPGRVDTQ